MRSIEKEGKTIDEAIWKGLQELNLKRDEVTIEVIDTGSKGLFGLGARPARVLLIAKDKTDALDLSIDLDIRGILRGEESITTPSAESHPSSVVSVLTTKEEVINTSPITGSTPPPSQSNRPKRTNHPETSRPNVEAYPDEPQSASSQRIAEQLNRKQSATLPFRSVEHLKQIRPEDRRRQSPSGHRERNERNERDHHQVSGVKPPANLVAPTEGAALILHTFLNELFEAMTLPCVVGIKQTDNLLVASIYGTGNDLGLLIGKHGSTLDALQYLSSLAVNRNSGEEHYRVQIHIGDYRKRREETLTRLALRIAEKVIREGNEQRLEPMLANERRLIHLALQENPLVETTSDGEEPNRFVIVRLRKPGN